MAFIAKVLPAAGMPGMKPPLAVPRQAARKAALSPEATMSWISAVMLGEAAGKMRQDSMAPVRGGYPARGTAKSSGRQ
jgi:hypothetical protein